jgi:hypothetical protein
VRGDGYILQVNGYRVFYINPREKIEDVVALIEQTMARRLALVVHGRNHLLSNSLNLNLIKKAADRYQKEIILINPEPVIIERLIDYGFKVFPDLNTLEQDLPLKQEAAVSEDEKTGLLTWIVGIFLLFFVLIMGYFYFLYPIATIEIEPVVKEVRKEMVLSSSTLIKQIDWENRVLPLHEVEVDLTYNDEVKTTGASLIGQTKATGIIKFINEVKEEITIPAGTIIRTAEDISFQTVQSVKVPGLKVDYLMDLPVGMRAGQAEVEIEALKKGSGGNIGTGQIKHLEKGIDDIYAINPEPTRGGKDIRISIVTEEDIERLRRNLEEQLRNRLITKLYQEMGGNYRVIEEEIIFSKPEISLNYMVGDTTETLKATGRLSARSYLLKNSELDRMVTTIFQDSLEEEYNLLSSGVNIEELILEEKDSGLYNIEIGLLAPVVPVIDASDLIKEIKGRDLQTVSEFLQEKPDISEYRIQIKGSNLPKFNFAIKVIVSEPDAYEVFSSN